MTQCVITLEKECRVNSIVFSFSQQTLLVVSQAVCQTTFFKALSDNKSSSCSPKSCTHYAESLFNESSSQHLHGTFPQKPHNCSVDSLFVRNFHAIYAGSLICCFCGDVAEIFIGTGQFLFDAMILLYV
jgi:hypothetical protein